MKKRIKVPEHIKDSGRKWLKTVLAEYEFTGSELNLLFVAASCIDRLQEIREQIASEGLTVPDRFGQMKAHPLLSAERDNRLVLSRLCNQLKIVTSEGVK